MRVDFGFSCGFVPGRIAEFSALARQADDGGVAMVTTGDSSALFGDIYVGMAAIALATERCQVGCTVTNPLTRHPALAASSASTVQEISHGRVALAIGTGDSAAYNLGLAPATLDYLEAYIATMRSLWDTGEAVWDGRPCKLNWTRRRVPIFMTPGGPKGLRLAGRIADGVIIEAGVLPDVIDDALAHLASGAAEAGRRLEDIEVWWHLRAAFGPSREAAIHSIRGALAGMMNRLARFSGEGKAIPPELRGPLDELKARYDFLHHAQISRSADHNGDLLDTLGLTEYAADRFGMVGTPADWIAAVGALAERGARRLFLPALGPDPQGYLKVLTEEVIPRFRE
jgi:5,10-methylenetetrahydromethanopterin reductase